MKFWLVVGVAALAFGLTGAAAAQPGGRPALGALRGSVNGVRGTGFKPAEHVVVTLLVAGKPVQTRRAVPSRKGSFVVRFSFEIPACTPWLVRAVGARSGLAWFKSPARECSPKVAV